MCVISAVAELLVHSMLQNSLANVV